jgi:hypothetical protein
MGGDYQRRYHNRSEILALFNQMPLDVFVVPRKIPPRPHARLLIETVTQSPQQWKQVFPSPGSDASSAYLVYEFLPARPIPREEVLQHAQQALSPRLDLIKTRTGKSAH